MNYIFSTNSRVIIFLLYLCFGCSDAIVFGQGLAPLPQTNKKPVSITTRSTLAIPNTFEARSLSPRKLGYNSPDPFPIGNTFAKPNIFDATSLDDLILKTAGKPKTKTIKKYKIPKNFLKENKNGMAGKAFEAIVANLNNKMNLKAATKTRLIPTAALGDTGHSADLLEIGPDGKILDQYQAKLSWKEGEKALFKAEYEGMKVMIPSDQMEILKIETQKKIIKCQRRGLPLDQKTKSVWDAIEIGRITCKTPSGAILPTKEKILELYSGHLTRNWPNQKEIFDKLIRNMPGPKIGQTKILPTVIPKASFLGKAYELTGQSLGKTLFVADVFLNGFETYQDVNRYRSSDIGGSYFGYKIAMRGTGFYLGFLLMNPEPFVSKTAFVSLCAIVAIDYGIDSVYEKNKRHSQQLLESIDRDERFHSVRNHLLKRF